MNKNKGFVMSTYVYMLLVFFLLVLGTLLLVLNNTKLLANKSKTITQNDFVFELNGSIDEYVFKDTIYEDSGVIATSKGNSLKDYVITTSNVDTTTLGDYLVTYEINYNGVEKTLEKKVHVVEDELDLEYTGDSQKFVVPADGYYKVELWGAQGGKSMLEDNTRDVSKDRFCFEASAGACAGGRGAYTSGYIYLERGTELYIYVGGKGGDAVKAGTSEGGYNGGGSGDHDHSDNEADGGGGGATDIRLVGGIWNDAKSLNSRIMVAAGGSGASDTYSGMPGGDLLSIRTNIKGYTKKTGYTLATQTSGYQFGAGQNGSSVRANYPLAGAGGGYYGGYSIDNGTDYDGTATGGTSFISGYAGVNAITSESDRTHTDNTLHYSNKYFIDGKMMSGVNEGNGRAVIKFVSETKPVRLNTKLNGVRYIRDCTNGSTSNAGNHWVELQAIKDGVNIAKGKTITGTVSAYAGANTGYSYVVDGRIENITGSTGWGASSADALHCVTVDLGSIYDLDEVATWRYYPDERMYHDNSLSVSSNNSSWTLLVSNNGRETSNGKRVSAYSPHSSASQITTSTGNILTNNLFATTTEATYGWDTTLNRNPALVATGWGGGYNSGVADPTVGYHARFDNAFFNYNVLVFPNLNRSNGHTNRWEGVAQTIAAGTVTSNTNYKVYMDIYCTHPGMRIHGGIYYKDTSTNGYKFDYNTGYYSYYTKEEDVGRWIPLAFELRTPSTVTTSATTSFYIYGMGGTDGTIFVRNVYLRLA